VADLELHLERVVNAPPERVFAAGVDPNAVAAWWGPAGFTSPSVSLDARVGGRYRIAMQPPEGSLFHLRGEFRAVDPPDRLVYTFVWEEPGPDDRESLVSLVFRRAPEGTTVVLDQGLFESEERYALHEAGWRDTLERLARFLG
jgi:uncharacterized protein YndB with AHSA1/START domain